MPQPQPMAKVWQLPERTDDVPVAADALGYKKFLDSL